MKQVRILLTACVCILCIYSCGQSDAEKAAIEKAREDSLTIVKIRDSIAAVRRVDSIREADRQDSIRTADAIIDTISNIINNAHGDIEEPTAETDESNNDYSILDIINNTEYELTLRFSGGEVQSITISPNSQEALSLLKGTYKEAASVSNPGVIPFAGAIYLAKDRYSQSFHIVGAGE